MHASPPGTTRMEALKGVAARMRRPIREDVALAIAFAALVVVCDAGLSAAIVWKVPCKCRDRC